MEKYGLFRVAAAMPKVKVADVYFNAEQINGMIEKAENLEVSLIVFPELSVTGYTCGDLFGQNHLIEHAEKAVADIRNHTRGKFITVIVGAPVKYCDRLYNCAVVIRNGMIRGIVPKIFLPNYNEFYETRWFATGADFLSKYSVTSNENINDGKNFYRPGFGRTIKYAGFETTISPNQLFCMGQTTFAVEICEDMWTPIPPSSYHCLAGAQIIANLSASNDVLNKHIYRKQLLSDHSARTLSAYIYSSAGFGESSQDLVYSGAALIYENGFLMKENDRFALDESMIISDVDVERMQTLRRRTSTFYATTPDGTTDSMYLPHYSVTDIGDSVKTDFTKRLYREIDPHPFIPGPKAMEKYSGETEIVMLQLMGLATRLHHIGSRNVVIGISGGLDSTLALLVCVLAFDKMGWDRKGIHAITMPGFATSPRTLENAKKIMNLLKVSHYEINIAKSVKQHLEDIGHDCSKQDVTYENAQARERTQILMDFANKVGGIVIGTGDLSELALGWMTYNGDQMSMYSVNGSVPKTLVKHLVENMGSQYFKQDEELSRILQDIVQTPISPELKSDSGRSQHTEEIIGPYELHDFFLYNYMKYGYSPNKILFMAEHAFDGKNGHPHYEREFIKKVLKIFMERFFRHQFKRSCMPDGPKVGGVSLSPRGDLRMPSDAEVRLFLNDIE